MFRPDFQRWYIDLFWVDWFEVDSVGGNFWRGDEFEMTDVMIPTTASKLLMRSCQRMSSSLRKVDVLSARKSAFGERLQVALGTLGEGVRLEQHEQSIEGCSCM